MLSVSSLFRNEMSLTNPQSVARIFTFANSDVTALVAGFGTITRNISNVAGKNFSIRMDNTGGAFNNLRTDKTQFGAIGQVDYGFNVSTGVYDTETFFKGRLVSASFNEAIVTLNFQDKIADLKNIFVGSEVNTVAFVNSNYNPADIVWSVVTSFGGLSAITSTSNPDIDYGSWQRWHGDFANENYFMNAIFKGTDVLKVLSTFRDLTDSFIYAEGDNRLHFSRWVGSGTANNSYNLDQIISTNPSINGLNITNAGKVSYGYNISSRQWLDEYTFQDSSSVNTYGEYNKQYGSTTIWHVNKTSAANLIQRRVARYGEPPANISVQMPITAIDIQNGDIINIEDSQYDIGRSYLIMEKTIDFENMTLNFTLEDGYAKDPLLWAFVTDNASLGLTDFDYNPTM